MSIVGRKKEIKELNELYNSDKAELVAVYGRRRVGKTFLVDESLSGKFCFRHTGLSPIEAEVNNRSANTGKQGSNALKQQLKQFSLMLSLDCRTSTTDCSRLCLVNLLR